MVVVSVLGAVLGEGGVDQRFEGGEVCVGRPGYKERADLGTNEVVGTTGAEKGEILGVGRVDEAENIVSVSEAGDPAIFGADAATEIGCNLDGEGSAIGAGGNGFSAEANWALVEAVVMDELADLVNKRDGVEVALALGVAPGE